MQKRYVRMALWDIPGDGVDKNSLASAGDTGQSLVQKIPHAVEQLSPVPQLLKPEPRSPGSTAKEATSRRCPCTSGKSSTPLPHATRESSCAATKTQSNQN